MNDLSSSYGQLFQLKLSNFNQHRLLPSHVEDNWSAKLKLETAHLIDEGEFVENQRQLVQPYLTDLPKSPIAFMQWFELLKKTGPGQGDSLFPWLAELANMDQMCWFLSQEAAGEAGFDDLVAMTQVRLPIQAKLEMARNYWDEMGRGHERGMHGPMLATVVQELKLTPNIASTVWQSLALANLMLAMAVNRRYTYQSIGALGAIEMTAPTRVGFVNDGLKRLNVTLNARKYFQLHATLDIAHSKAWNDEVIYSIVKETPTAMKPIAEGALMRLMCGQRCFDQYRAHFGFNTNIVH